MVEVVLRTEGGWGRWVPRQLPTAELPAAGCRFREHVLENVGSGMPRCDRARIPGAAIGALLVLPARAGTRLSLGSDQWQERRMELGRVLM